MSGAERDMEAVVELVMSRLCSRGYAQVKGYNRFEYVRHTDGTVTVLRENGNTVDVRLSAIRKAIEAVRTDPTVYDKGPSALRAHGITHVNSPIWSMLHLATLEELT